MNIQVIAAYIICLVVPCLFVMAYLVHHIVTKEISSEEADRMVGRVLLVGTGVLTISFLFGYLIHAITQKAWTPFVQTALGLLLVFSTLGLIWTRSNQIKNEKVMLNLGRVESGAMRLAGYVFSLGFFVTLFMVIGENDFTPGNIGQVAFLGGAGFFWSIVGFGNVYFTENGIFRNQQGLMRWHDIKSYEWGGNLGSTLILYTVKGGKVWFRLKIRQEKQVNEILNRFLPTDTTMHSETFEFDQLNS